MMTMPPGFTRVLSITLFAIAPAAIAGPDIRPAKPGFSLERITIGEATIHAVVLSKAEVATKRPAVILIHGGSIIDALMAPGLPYKEEWFRPVYEDVPYGLAAQGMVVVAIDAAWAESRLSPEDRAQSVRPELLFTYYIQAARELSQVVDYLCERPDVDPARIAVAGKSGGAITALIAACQEPRLAVVVSWKGGADFIEMTRLKGQQRMLDEMFMRDASFRDILERADPIHHFEGIPPKAVALINIRDDPAMPRQGAEALYEALRPLYANSPERLTLTLVDTPKPTHDDQIEAFDAGRAFLEKHLLQKE